MSLVIPIIKLKYYDDSNVLVVGKMENEMGGIFIDKFVGLKPKMYSILLNDSSEYKKAKGINKNVVVKISHNDNKNVLLNKKCLDIQWYE